VSDACPVGSNVVRVTGQESGVVLISQPVHQHGYETAVAAQEAALLRYFVTGIYYTGRGLMSAGLLRRLPSEVRASIERELLRRRHSELDPALVYTIPNYHVLATGVRRIAKHIPSLQRLGLETRAHLRFDRAVGRLLPRLPGLRIVHAFEGSGLETLRSAKRLGLTTVLDVTSVQEDSHAALFDSATRISLSRIRAERELADMMVVPSDYAIRCLLENGVSAEKILKIPYGVDHRRFSPERVLRTDDRPFRVLFVGTITQHKGVRYLLEAWRRLDLRNAELVLIGEPDHGGCEILREFQGLYEWPGSVPKYAVDECFKSVDVLVLPSLSDSWGLVVTEAMACGIPVIVTTNTGAPVRDEVDGFVVAPADSAELAERILFLYEHASIRKEMGVRAREHVVRAYTWEHYRAGIAQAYNTILSGHQAQGEERRATERVHR
jgi:alpha-maltose-1-phosphate synthase